MGFEFREVRITHILVTILILFILGILLLRDELWKAAHSHRQQ